MASILSAALGFAGSMVKPILDYQQDKIDKAHELAILQLQIDRDKSLGVMQTQQIEYQGDTSMLTAAINTLKTNVPWIDALNGTIRPVVTYGIFLDYVTFKILNIIRFWDTLTIEVVEKILWTQFDSDLLAVVLGFWFGQRMFNRSK